MSLPFYFKFGASDVLSGLESTHGTRSLLLFSARRRPCPLCWRAGKALSIYLPPALSATTSRFPDRPRPMLLHSSCSAPFPGRPVDASESVRVESMLLHLRLPRLGRGVKQLVGVEPLQCSVGQLADSGWGNEYNDRTTASKNRQQNRRTELSTRPIPDKYVEKQNKNLKCLTHPSHVTSSVFKKNKKNWKPKESSTP